MWRAISFACISIFGCQPELIGRGEGPMDVWAYADPGVPVWKRVHLPTVRGAVSTLNSIVGDQRCWRVVEQEWTEGEPPSGVAVVVVDQDLVLPNGSKPGEEIEVRGVARLTDAGGGWVATLSTSSHDDYVVAHELIHIALGERWDHDKDENSLFSEAPEGWEPRSVEPRTAQALREFCGR